MKRKIWNYTNTPYTLTLTQYTHMHTNIQIHIHLWTSENNERSKQLRQNVLFLELESFDQVNNTQKSYGNQEEFFIYTQTHIINNISMWTTNE